MWVDVPAGMLQTKQLVREGRGRTEGGAGEQGVGEMRRVWGTSRGCEKPASGL